MQISLFSYKLTRQVTLIIATLLGFVFSVSALADQDIQPYELDAYAARSNNGLGCLALNIYHEGRGEPMEGQAAIATVTMNRVSSKHYPNTVCAVVWQHKQFSWTQTAERFHTVTNLEAWQRALTIARIFIRGVKHPQVADATHYHAEYVRPYWIAEREPTSRIGKHFFYAL